MIGAATACPMRFSSDSFPADLEVERNVVVASLLVALAMLATLDWVPLCHSLPMSHWYCDVASEVALIAVLLCSWLLRVLLVVVVAVVVAAALVAIVIFY